MNPALRQGHAHSFGPRIMTPMLETLRRNLGDVRARIAAACGRAGRDPAGVTLVCVTKYADEAWVRGLYDLGERHFGESRPQQLTARREAFPGDVRWHLIGQLQSNKVRPAVRAADVVHSVASRKLLDRCARISDEEGVSPRLLLQINVSGEASKQGFVPEELTADLAAPAAVAGLMTMAPAADDPASVRPVFERLAALRDRLASEAGRPLPDLSMGMSGDFEPAVECGATLVRVGSRLFAGLA